MDPLAGNMPMTTSFTPQMMMQQMQFKLINGLNLGDIDPMVGQMLKTFIIVVFGAVALRIPTIMDTIKDYGLWFTKSGVYVLYVWIISLFPKEYVPQIVYEERSIKYVTSQNIKNKLYEAVHYYLTTQVKVKSEAQFELSIEENRNHSSHNSDDTISLDMMKKNAPDSKNFKFKFREYSVDASFDTEDMPGYTPQSNSGPTPIGSNRKNRVINIKIWKNDDDKTDVIQKFVDEVINIFNRDHTQRKWTQKTYVNRGADWIEVDDCTNWRRLKTIILKESQMNIISTRIQRFNKDADWCHERGISNSYSVLLHGPPGTGKTTFCQSISNEMKRHQYFFNLCTIKNDDEFLDLYKKIPLNDAVIYIEDIDAMDDVVKDRELVKKMKEERQARRQQAQEQNMFRQMLGETIGKGEKVDDKVGITLAALLNILQGNVNYDGRILIMTTNFPKDLDAALTRKGRIDHTFHLDNCDEYQIIEMFKLYFSNNNEPCPADKLDIVRNELIPRFIGDDKVYPITPAELSSVLKDNKESIDGAIDDLREWTPETFD